MRADVDGDESTEISCEFRISKLSVWHLIRIQGWQEDISCEFRISKLSVLRADVDGDESTGYDPEYRWGESTSRWV